MTLQGRFTFISSEVRDGKDNKKYYNVNIESEDGQLMRLGIEPDIITKMQKYKSYNGYFGVNTYNNSMYMRLLEVEELGK